MILLSGRCTDDEVSAGFEEGADDYVTKPFSMRILSYRLRAVVQRSRMSGLVMSAAHTIYRLGSGLFDAEQSPKSRHGRPSPHRRRPASGPSPRCRSARPGPPEGLSCLDHHVQVV